MSRATLARMTRYGVVGVTANGLGLIVFQSLVWAGLAPELATFTAFFPAVACAYLLNRFWSFSSAVAHGPAMLRYFIVTIVSLFTQIAIVSLLYRGFGAVPILAQLAALAICTPLAYLATANWVFRSGPASEGVVR